MKTVFKSLYEEHLVPPAIAYALKKIGFDEACFAWCMLNDIIDEFALPAKIKLSNCGRYYTEYAHANMIQFPTWEQASNWMFKNHNININFPLDASTKNHNYEIQCLVNEQIEEFCGSAMFSSKEEAKVNGFFKAIEIIVNRPIK